jgi:hypothetical protein
MQQVSPTGVCLDNRPEDQKLADYKHEEIAMGFKPYVWEERPAKPKYFFPYDQKSSLSCVAGGGAIILEKFDNAIISRKDIYNRRVNYPTGGMMLHDVLTVIRKGVAEEKLVTSQGLGENQMNMRYAVSDEIIKSRAKHKVTQTFIIESRNIDSIASVLETSPVIGFWYFDEEGKEWWKPQPEILYNFSSYVAQGVTRHQVAIVDAILIDGKKYLVGQDTAGVGSGAGANSNLRYISEEVVNKRLYAAGYAIDDEDAILIPNNGTKPKYINFKVLKVGSRGKEVQMLQEVLMYEGLLSIKQSTQYFGGLTRAAVVKLQEKYRDDILKPGGFKSGTGIAATLTNLFLNTKYK